MRLLLLASLQAALKKEAASTSTKKKKLNFFVEVLKFAQCKNQAVLKRIPGFLPLRAALKKEAPSGTQATNDRASVVASLAVTDRSAKAASSSTKKKTSIFS